jgi:hypothetical protein
MPNGDRTGTPAAAADSAFGRRVQLEGEAIVNEFDVSKIAYEILVPREELAEKLSVKIGGLWKKTDDGWIVQKSLLAYSDTDPIAKAIKAAIERLA